MYSNITVKMYSSVAFIFFHITALENKIHEHFIQALGRHNTGQFVPCLEKVNIMEFQCMR